MHLKKAENVISENIVIVVIMKTKNVSLQCYIRYKYTIIEIKF